MSFHFLVNQRVFFLSYLTAVTKVRVFVLYQPKLLRHIIITRQIVLALIWYVMFCHLKLLIVAKPNTLFVNRMKAQTYVKINT